MNNYQIEHYLGKAPIGAKIFYYPGGRKDVNTIPRIGWVQVPHPRGICDVAVLPSQDGAVERIDHVPHIGDQRVFDHQGNLSRMAITNGCWEFHPDELATREVAAHREALLELIAELSKPEDNKSKKQTSKAS
jgi:hypothetical protein